MKRSRLTPILEKSGTVSSFAGSFCFVPGTRFTGEGGEIREHFEKLVHMEDQAVSRLQGLFRSKAQNAVGLFKDNLFCIQGDMPDHIREAYFL